MSNELKTFWLLVICGTILGLSAISHDSACLTGHDIDAKIQQNYLETTQPQTKKEPTP